MEYELKSKAKQAFLADKVKQFGENGFKIVGGIFALGVAVAFIANFSSYKSAVAMHEQLT